MLIQTRWLIELAMPKTLVYLMFSGGPTSTVKSLLVAIGRLPLRTCIQKPYYLARFLAMSLDHLDVCPWRFLLDARFECKSITKHMVLRLGAI